jgi:hypothetical protein
VKSSAWSLTTASLLLLLALCAPSRAQDTLEVSYSPDLGRYLVPRHLVEHFVHWSRLVPAQTEALRVAAARDSIQVVEISMLRRALSLSRAESQHQAEARDMEHRRAEIWREAALRERQRNRWLVAGVGAAVAAGVLIAIVK